MLTKLPYIVSPELMKEAVRAIFHDETEEVLNEPTGRFFYDKWTLKPRYNNTVWQTILNLLPYNIGEAKIRKLNAGQAYICHADIDNRYHLNITGEHSYLTDLDNNILYPTVSDNTWYSMNAGRKHSAVNFGNRPRFQLVVRQLLLPNVLTNPLPVVISSSILNHDEARYIFDSTISPWLNLANKNSWISNFSYDSVIKFNIEYDKLADLKAILPKEFNLS